MQEEKEEEATKAASDRSAEAGRIHIDEEFRKAKRNLIWFCSFAILLSVVQSSPDGKIQPPLLGGEVSIEIDLLRLFVLLGCVYTLIGFYRQARDVDLVNSELVYAVQFQDIRQNLYDVGRAMASISRELHWVLTYGPRWYSLPHNIQQAYDNVTGAAEALDEAGRQLVRLPPPQPREQMLSAWAGAHERFTDTLHAEMDGIAVSAEYNEGQLKALKEVVNKLEPALARYWRLQPNFKRLSRRIRSDHLFLYRWYDKYLAYLLFIVASAATLWRIFLSP